MLDINELDDIYDEGKDEEDEKPVKVKPMSFAEFDEGIANNPGSRAVVGQSGDTSPVDVEAYKGYNIEGVYSNRDINAVRGENQSAWNKVGNFIPRTIAKVATGFIEGLGYTGALISEWGDDRDYSNGLTELAKSMNQSLEEALPIYRTTNKTFGFGDLGWWLQNAEGIISSVGSFALEGAGFAKLLGTAGKASRLAGLARTVTGGVKLGQETARVATAGMLAYLEGAQMGKNVFDQVYKVQLEKGLAQGLDTEQAQERAKHISAESAATTVQLNTMLNTGMNMWSVLPFFNHEANAIENIAKKNFFQRSGESVADWGKRVGDYTIDNFKRQAFRGEGKIAMAREAALEGVEELTNQFAERTGIEEGKAGNTYGILGQLGQLSKYFERTMDSEGALNFAMGAIAGPMTTVVTNNIPIHRQVTGYAQNEAGELLDVNGQVTDNPEQAAKTYAKGDRLADVGKWITSRTKNKYGNTQYFNNIQEAIVADIKAFQDLHNDIAREANNGNHSKAEALKYELFNTQSKRAVQLGFADNLIETYQQILDLDNTKSEKEVLKAEIDSLVSQIEAGKRSGVDTRSMDEELVAKQQQYNSTPEQTEAMRSGFTASPDDNTYKEKAQQAIKDLKDLQRIHEKVQSKYGLSLEERIHSEDNLLSTHLADFIFDRYANLHLAKNQASRYQQRLNELQDEQKSLEDVLGDEALNDFMTEKQSWLRERTMQIGRQATAVTEDSILETAQKDPSITNINAAMKVLQKHGAIGVTEADNSQAIKDTRKKLDDIITESKTRISEGDETLLTSTGYQTWLDNHPGKTFKDYQDEIQRKYELSEEEKHLQTNLGVLNDQIQSNAKNLREIETAKTLTRIRKATKNWLSELSKERQSQLNSAEAVQQKRVLDKALQNKLELERIKQQQVEAVAEMQEIQDKMSAISNELEDVTQEMQMLNERSNLNIDISTEAKRWQDLEDRKNSLLQELNKLSNRYNLLKTVEQKATEDIVLAEQGINPSIDDITSDDLPATETGYTDNAPADDITIQQDILDTSSDVVSKIPAQPSPVIPPASDYLTALQQYSPNVQLALEELRKEATQSGHVRFDDFNSLVSNGSLSQQDAREIALLMQDYIAAVDQEINELENIQEEIKDVTSEVLPEPVLVDLMSEEGDAVITHDTFPVDGRDPGINIIPNEEDKSFVGNKVIDAVSTLAGSDLLYTEGYNPVTREYFKQSGLVLNPEVSTVVLDPEELTPGTVLTLSIDEQYTGAKSNTENLNTDSSGKIIHNNESFEDYVDSEGKIKTDDESIGNVPIQALVPGDDSKLRYLRTVRWITAKYDVGKGPEGYRNVYDGSEDREDVPVGNVERQAKEMLELRRKLVEIYNRTGSLQLPIKVVSKGAGTVILNTKPGKDNTKPSNITWDLASVLLPDPDITFAISTTSGNKIVLQEKPDTVTEKDIVNADINLPNRAWALLPAPNGQYHLGLLKGVSLATGTTALNTITRVIELHLLGDTQNADVLAISQNTGFNILDVKGLRAFINQYFTYTSNWTPTTYTDKEFSILDIQPPATGEFNSKVLIANVMQQGNNEQYATLVDGKLSPSFIRALSTMLGQRFRNIVFTKDKLGIRGINDRKEAEFVEVKADKNGKLTFVSHTSYNEFIKNYLSTNVYGLNTIKTPNVFGQLKDTYVYAVNPQIEVDFSEVQEMPTVNTQEDITEIPTPKAEQPSDLDLADIISNIYDARPDVIIQDAMDITGREVTISNLRTLYDLAGENHNGKAIDEVYTYLLQNGISTLYDGFNPFIRCN